MACQTLPFIVDAILIKFAWHGRAYGVLDKAEHVKQLNSSHCSS